MTRPRASLSLSRAQLATLRELARAVGPGLLHSHATPANFGQFQKLVGEPLDNIVKRAILWVDSDRRYEQMNTDILNTVIENGRVDDDGNGNFDRDSLIVEIEFEAQERGLTPDEVEEAVAWALAHTMTN